MNVGIYLSGSGVEAKPLLRLAMQVPPVIGDEIRVLNESFIVRNRVWDLPKSETGFDLFDGIQWLSIYVQPLAAFQREVAQLNQNEA